MFDGASAHAPVRLRLRVNKEQDLVRDRAIVRRRLDLIMARFEVRAPIHKPVVPFSCSGVTPEPEALTNIPGGDLFRPDILPGMSYPSRSALRHFDDEAAPR